MLSRVMRCRLQTITGLRWLKIHANPDVCGTQCSIYVTCLIRKNYVFAKYGDASTEDRLASSRLLILHRETADVFL